MVSYKKPLYFRRMAAFSNNSQLAVRAKLRLRNKGIVENARVWGPLPIALDAHAYLQNYANTFILNVVRMYFADT